MDPLLTIDRSALLKEIRYCHTHMNVTESMLMSLGHMQVAVCYLRQKYNKGLGVPGFHKNIICFPQDLTELKRLTNFFAGLEVHDVVNVILPGDDTATLRRAVITEIKPTHFEVVRSTLLRYFCSKKNLA